MRRGAIAGTVVLVAGLGAAWWWSAQRAAAPPAPEAPAAPQALPYDEPVELRWVDEETGEEDVWKVTKRDTAPEDRPVGPALPEPDPDAASHVPDESARALTAMGIESWKRGEIRGAMAQLAGAIEADPDDPLPRTQYGRLKALAREYTEALPHLERAAALRPDDPQVWLDLASTYQKAGVLDRFWEARRRAEALADGRAIVQDETTGFWVLEDGERILP